MVLIVFKMIATSGFLAALECSKFVFRRGELTALPRPSSWFKGPTSKGEGEKEEWKREGKGRGMGDEGRGGTAFPITQIPRSAPESGGNK